MPDVSKVNLKQFAVVWPHEGDTKWGQPKLGTPYQVKCRWVKSSQNMVSTEETTSYPTIRVPVDQAVPLGSLMRLGKLVDLPANPSDVYEVLSLAETPDLKVRSQHTAYSVTLRKFASSIPASVLA